MFSERKTDIYQTIFEIIKDKRGRTAGLRIANASLHQLSSILAKACKLSHLSFYLSTDMIKFLDKLVKNNPIIAKTTPNKIKIRLYRFPKLNGKIKI